MSSSYKVIGSILEGVSKGDFDWTINICCSDNILESFDKVKSPTFSFASFPWHVEMGYRKGSTSLFLYKEDCEKPHGVTVSLNIIFLNMEIRQRGSQTVYYSEDNNAWGWNYYILRKDLLDHWTKASKICCELIIRIKIRDLVPAHEEGPLHKIRLKEKEILNQNYKDMLFDDEDHDLILKVKDKEFKAHRLIMKSRCPVFKSMLSHEMLEKNSGVVDIPDCDPSAFEQFLLYIYTGELDILDNSTMLGLYYIADKYGMENLRKECCAYIKKSLSVHVICDVIKLALDLSDTELLEIATKYFLNNAKETSVTVGWMSFMKENPIQANELIVKALTKIPCRYNCR